MHNQEMFESFLQHKLDKKTVNRSRLERYYAGFAGKNFITNIESDH